MRGCSSSAPLASKQGWDGDLSRQVETAQVSSTQALFVGITAKQPSSQARAPFFLKRVSSVFWSAEWQSQQLTHSRLPGTRLKPQRTGFAIVFTAAATVRQMAQEG